MRFFLIGFMLTLFWVLVPLSQAGQPSEFVVYSVYQKLNLGERDEVPQKDYLVNMGSKQGLQEGSILEVMRRAPTYDLISNQLYRDMTFPIARVKVIHVETTAAVTRLEKLLPAEQTPAANPRAIMVGDVVRVANGK